MQVFGRFHLFSLAVRIRHPVNLPGLVLAFLTVHGIASSLVAVCERGLSGGAVLSGLFADVVAL